MSIVIAICGTMGSGKTTAVENIAAALPDCETLHEDDFNRTTDRSIDDITAWRAQPGNAVFADRLSTDSRAAISLISRGRQSEAALEKSDAAE